VSDRLLTRYGPWAVVTGASSGIGAEFARQLAGRGLSVALAARRRERLEQLAEALRARHGVGARVIEADLAARSGRAAVIEGTRDLDVGLLVSNAGFGMKGEHTGLSLERLLSMVEVNCAAMTELTHGFGRRLTDRGRGGMVLVSSSAAFQGTPFTAAYAATKGFCLQLAEGLWDELRPRGVDVLALCPGPVDTEGPRRTGVDPDRIPVKMMSVGPVVRAALRDLGRRPLTIPGGTNRLGAFATRLLPRAWVTRLAGRVIRRVSGGQA
jgi:short-subunit dehydrogenase